MIINRNESQRKEADHKEKWSWNKIIQLHTHAHTLADPIQMKARNKKQVKQYRQYRKQQFKSEGRKEGREYQSWSNKRWQSKGLLRWGSNPISSHRHYNQAVPWKNCFHFSFVPSWAPSCWWCHLSTATIYNFFVLTFLAIIQPHNTQLRSNIHLI